MFVELAPPLFLMAIPPFMLRILAMRGFSLDRLALPILIAGGFSYSRVIGWLIFAHILKNKIRANRISCIAAISLIPFIAIMSLMRFMDHESLVYVSWLLAATSAGDYALLQSDMISSLSDALGIYVFRLGKRKI